MLDTWVLQTYRIKHTAWRFGDAGARIALPAVERNALGRHSSKRCNIDEIRILTPSSERTGGDSYRVFHDQAAEIDSHINLCALRAGGFNNPYFGHLPHHLACIEYRTIDA